MTSAHGKPGDGSAGRDQPTKDEPEELGDDPSETNHPAGEEHARRNTDNEPPG